MRTESSGSNKDNMDATTMGATTISMVNTSQDSISAIIETANSSSENIQTKPAGTNLGPSVEAPDVNSEMSHSLREHTGSSSLLARTEKSSEVFSSEQSIDNQNNNAIHAEIDGSFTEKVDDVELEKMDSQKEAAADAAKLPPIVTTDENITATTVDSGGGGDYGDGRPMRQTRFNPSDSVRVQRMLLATVEELRMRRAMDSENEDRIRQLMFEKHEVEARCHDAQSKIINLEKLIEEKVAQAKRESKSAMQDIMDSKAKLLSKYQTSENDVKSLKDEIRSLQLQNYTLEKKLREQERKSELSSHPNDSHLSQIPALEMKCAAVVKRAEALSATCALLDKNVKEACKINTRLVYQNEHSRCEVSKYKAEISSLQQQLIEVRTSAAFEPEKLNHQINMLETEIASLNRQIGTEKSIAASLRKQVARGQCEQKTLNQRLSESHVIIAKQTTQAKEATEEMEKLNLRHSSLEEEHKQLANKCQKLESTIAEERLKYKKEYEELNGKAQVTEHELETLRATHKYLLKNHDELQELNSAWAKKNVELSQKVTELKAELEKPKSDREIQVSADTVEVEAQTQVDITSTCSQTLCSCLTRVDNEAQTTYVATVCSAAQTIYDATFSTASQTERLHVEDKNICTEISYTHYANIGQGSTKHPQAKGAFRSPGPVLDSGAKDTPHVTTSSSTSSISIPAQTERKTSTSTNGGKEEVQSSPYSRFSASLRGLRSQTIQESPILTFPSISKATSTPTITTTNSTETRGGRLRLRSNTVASDRVAKLSSVENTSPTQSETSCTAAISGIGGRACFQFLHIPEQDRSSDVVDTVPPFPLNFIPGQSVGGDIGNTGSAVEQDRAASHTGTELLATTGSTDNKTTEGAAISSGKRPVSTPDPLVTGILAGTKESKPKKAKKTVHFAATRQEKTIPPVENSSGSDTDLFSEDEDQENMELRNSQVSRIEHVLSEDDNCDFKMT